MFDIGFPRDWSSLKKLIWLKAAISGGGASAVWKTVTGTLIHITNALASPMRKCEVTLEPIQDLHGQDAPYPAGGGKNIAYLEQGSLDMSTGAEISSTTRVRTNFIPVEYASPVGIYYVASSQNNGWSVRNGVGYDENKSYVSNGVYPASDGKFTVLNPDIKYVRFIYSHVNTSESCSPSDYWYQFERGSTPTTYSPYENICPITGWTRCEVNVTGVNIWNKENLQDGYIDNANGELKGSSPYKNTGFVKVSPSSKYYIKTEQSGSAWGAWYDENKIFISGITLYQNKEITSPNNAHYIRLTVKSAVTGDENTFGINYPSTFTDYYPFGTTLSVTFPDSAGTVYGGTVDLVSGVLTVDRAIVDMGTLSWGYALWNNKNYTFAATLSGMKSGGTKSICSQYPRVSASVMYGDIVDFCYCVNQTLIRVVDSRYTDAASFKTAMSGVQLVYELETPTEIQLTPQEISTLAGENNIWSDAQSMTVTYKADGIPSDVEALNMLLGGTYQNQGNPDDVTDKEALQILLGDKS